jgi:DNA modification methylase
MDSRRNKRDTKNKRDSNKEVKITGEFKINNMICIAGYCIEILKNIADEFINLIFAEPPYNFTVEWRILLSKSNKS